jgi:hypothetical protein
MPRQTFPQEAIDLPEGVPAVSRPVVIGPPFEVAVDLPDQLGQRLEAAFLVDHFPAHQAERLILRLRNDSAPLVAVSLAFGHDQKSAPAS